MLLNIHIHLLFMYIDITIRPVLKHGPRSSTEVQVLLVFISNKA